MAIRPEIALGVKSPQIESPLESAGKVIALRDTLDQSRLREAQFGLMQEQQKRATLDNQMLQESYNAKQDMDNLVQANTTFGQDGTFDVDLKKVAAGMAQKGHYNEAISVLKNEHDLKEGYWKEATAELTAQNAKEKAIGAGFTNTYSASDEQKAAAYAADTQALVKRKLLKQGEYPEQWSPEAANFVQGAVLKATEDPLGNWLKLNDEKRKATAETRAVTTAEQATQQHEVALKAANQDLELKTRKNEITRLAGATDQASWNAALAGIPEDRRNIYPAQFNKDNRLKTIKMGMTPEELAKFETNQGVTKDQLLLRAAQGDKDAQKALDLETAQKAKEEENKAAAPMKALGIDMTGAATDVQGGAGAPVSTLEKGKRNDAMLDKLPANVKASVTALLEGRMAVPQGRAMTDPYYRTVINLAQQIDPNFDAANYNARSKMRADYTAGNGTANKAIVALNTAVNHAELLDKSIDKLGNFQSVPFNKSLNEMRNWWKENVSGDMSNLNAFNNDRAAFAREMNRLWLATGGTLAELQEWEKGFNAAGTPKALHDSVKAGLELLYGKTIALYENYSKNMNMEKPDVDIVHKHTEEVLRKHGIDTSGIGGAQQAGPPAPAEEGAHVPPNGARYINTQGTKDKKWYSTDNGVTIYDTKTGKQVQ